MTWSGEAKEKLLLVSVCFFWKSDGGGGEVAKAFLFFSLSGSAVPDEAHTAGG